MRCIKGLSIAGNTKTVRAACVIEAMLEQTICNPASAIRNASHTTLSPARTFFIYVLLQPTGVHAHPSLLCTGVARTPLVVRWWHIRQLIWLFISCLKRQQCVQPQAAALRRVTASSLLATAAELQQLCCRVLQLLRCRHHARPCDHTLLSKSGVARVVSS